MVPRPGVATHGYRQVARQRVPVISIFDARIKKASHFRARLLRMVPRPGIATHGYRQVARQRVPVISIFNARIKKASHFRARLLRMVPRPGIEPGTRGFSIRCSTN